MALTNEEFEKYYNELYHPALGYTIKKVQNFENAEDLVMDAFTSSYKKKDEFDATKASFATWFYVVLNNKIKNYYRAYRQIDDIDDYDVAEESFDNVIVEGSYLDEMRAHLADALMILSETQRKIIILKYFQEKDSNDIAVELGIAAGNVRIQAMRALTKLKTEFDKKGISLEL